MSFRRIFKVQIDADAHHIFPPPGEDAYIAFYSVDGGDSDFKCLVSNNFPSGWTDTWFRKKVSEIPKLLGYVGDIPVEISLPGDADAITLAADPGGTGGGGGGGSDHL